MAASIWFALGAPAHADRYALEFEGAVFGIMPLGRLTLDLNTAEGRYQARGKLVSSGLLQLFEPTNLTATVEGEVLPTGPAFSVYDLDHYYAKKHRTIGMRRDETGLPIADIVPVFREWGDPPASEAHKRESTDPLTAIVAMAADVAAGRGCARIYPAFDGRFRYNLTLSDGREAKFDAGGYDGPVLKCKLTYEAIAGFNPKKENERRRLPEGEIWFALNGDPTLAPPVRVLIPMMGVAKAGLSLRSIRRASVAVTVEPGIPAPTP